MIMSKKDIQKLIYNFTDELLDITNPIFDNSQIECLNYIAGYAVFSYFKQSSECSVYHDFLLLQKIFKLITIGFSLINLLDRGSIKYPSENVYQSVVTMYEIFIKIDNHPNLSRRFYEGPCRRKLVDISLLKIERNSSEICMYGVKMGYS